MSYSQVSTQDQIAGINIIPLADVMLVLLVIFMIASPAVTRRVDFDLPGTGPRPPVAASLPPIQLRIDASGQAFWNGSATPVTALEAMMAAEVARDPANPPRLAIEASGEADYQAVTRVLAAAQNADLVRVAFVRQ